MLIIWVCLLAVFSKFKMEKVIFKFAITVFLIAITSQIWYILNSQIRISGDSLVVIFRKRKGGNNEYA